MVQNGARELVSDEAEALVLEYVEPWYQNRLGTGSCFLRVKVISIIHNQTFNRINSIKLNKSCLNHKLPLYAHDQGH